MSDIVLESSQAAPPTRKYGPKSLAAGVFGLTAGVALRLLMLQVVIKLMRVPPSKLN